MKLTPLDVRHQTFRKTLYGYSVEAVHDFLEKVVDSMEDLIRKSVDKEDEVKMLETLLDESRKKEGVFQEAVMSMQKLSDDIKNNGQKEATMVVEQAEMKSEQILRQSHEKLMTLMAEINEMKKQKIQFQTQLKNLLESHIRLLDIHREPSPYVSFSRREIDPTT